MTLVIVIKEPMDDVRLLEEQEKMGGVTNYKVMVLRLKEECELKTIFTNPRV